MTNAAQVKFGVKDNSSQTSVQDAGIVCLGGKTLRGPVADPGNRIIKSVPEFVALYGDYYEGGPDTPLLVKRFLEAGGWLRFSRIVHYTDPTSAASITATKAVQGSAAGAKEIRLAGALIAANVLAGTVNGNAVSQVYNTSNDNTLSLLAAQIAALANITSATVKAVSGSTANDRVIVVTPTAGNSVVLAGFSVTLGASQTTVSTGDLVKVIDDGGHKLFSFSPKYHGADYNNITIEVKASSNGDANYFNIEVVHTKEPSLNETYRNLIIPGAPSVINSSYLKAIAEQSQLLNLTYEDLSAITDVVAQFRPENRLYQLLGATDGGTVVAADYIGDAAGHTGFHSFDQVEDAMALAYPEISTTSIHIAGEAYVSSRGDMEYFAHLDNTNLTSDDLIAEKDAAGLDSEWVRWFAGGLKITNTKTSLTKEISELGDVLGLHAKSWKQNGTHYSVANAKRGTVQNCLGVVNNFGARALADDLDLLANNQINLVIQRNGVKMIWGNYTGKKSESLLSQASIKMLILSMQRDLTPTLEGYLEEPFHITTFRSLFLEAEPYLESKKTSKAIYDYDWQGDQDAKDMDSLVINTNPAAIVAGDYKIKLFLQPTPAIHIIEVEITIGPAGVSFKSI